MSSRTAFARRRAWTVALCCTLLLGCTTAPPAPAPTPKEAKAAALRSLGFAPVDDGWELNLGVKLLFDVDVDALSADGVAAVADVARTLRKLGIERIRVEGHTDNVGAAAYNAALSKRRAESVARQLVAIGWPADAIERRGFGPDKPVADNATPEGRAQNRRVVIAVPAD